MYRTFLPDPVPSRSVLPSSLLFHLSNIEVKMRINSLERALPDGTCNTGTVFYSCQVNNFRGCCSVDPCALPGCPDAAASSTRSQTAATSTTVQPNTGPALVSIPVLIVSPSTTITSFLSLPPSTTTMIPSTITSIVTTTNASSSPASSSTLAAGKPGPTNPSPGKSNTPIIVGVVCGVVALSVLSVLAWFCLRRRKQKQDVRNSIASYGVPSKEYVLERSTASTATKTEGNLSGVFEPFGGKSPNHHICSQANSTLGRYSSPPPTTTAPVLDHDQNDRTIGPRVSSLAVPQHSMSTSRDDLVTPVNDKPLADAEKRGLTPPPVHEHPFYHPLPGESPQVPAYHPGTAVHEDLTPFASPSLSTMTSHPAYHVSQLNQHPAFRSKSSSPPRESGFPRRTPEVQKFRPSSPPRELQHRSSNRNWRLSELSGESPITSPIPGRSELEAHVPSSYRTPAIIHEVDTPLRGNTGASTYSIPIGLGLDQHQRPLSLSTQMTGRVGPNLTSPRDGGHVMNWATDRYRKRAAYELEEELRFASEGPYRKKVISPEVVSPEERWSGATAVPFPQVRSPISAEGLSPEAGTGTWGSWSGR